MARTNKKAKKSRTGSILLSGKRRDWGRGLGGGGSAAGTQPTRTSAISSQASRSVIRTHHTLQKQLSQALQKDDTEAAEAIRRQIEANGGLDRYQQASVCGQSKQRGGDSSKILMEWVRESQNNNTARPKLKLLEVGALSADNCCSKSPLFTTSRIDLQSRDPSIEQQDFMERPLPSSDNEKFDIISLSLVLNFVPLAQARGEMLRRTALFLRDGILDPEDPLQTLFPSLFLVLPEPCVNNSRYLNEHRLDAVMESIGFRKEKSKTSSKLVYQLWRLTRMREFGGAPRQPPAMPFKKQEVNPGKGRNNFCIILE